MKELSRKRAIAAMPVGGSFRCIDFALSNMSNSHVQTVAVLTQYNARSLNEHLSSSKWWDFGRKQGGLYLFTPTVTAENSDWYRGTADAMYQNIDFLKKRHEPYVIITNGDCAYKMDYNKILDYHIEKLIEILEKAAEENRFDFVNDVLIRYKNIKKIYAYKTTEYWSNIASVDSYYQTNMDFLNPEVRSYFRAEPKIHSKVDDLPPAKYNTGSDVSNSLIASGCIINSKVENSILFKKVFIGKNCVIKNSIILNDAYIGDNTHVENCIVESRGTLKANTYYCGENGIKIVSEENERYML